MYICPEYVQCIGSVWKASAYMLQIYNRCDVIRCYGCHSTEHENIKSEETVRKKIREGKRGLERR